MTSLGMNCRQSQIANTALIDLAVAFRNLNGAIDHDGPNSQYKIVTTKRGERRVLSQDKMFHQFLDCLRCENKPFRFMFYNCLRINILLHPCMIDVNEVKANECIIVCSNDFIVLYRQSLCKLCEIHNTGSGNASSAASSIIANKLAQLHSGQPIIKSKAHLDCAGGHVNVFSLVGIVLLMFNVDDCFDKPERLSNTIQSSSILNFFTKLFEDRLVDPLDLHVPPPHNVVRGQTYLRCPDFINMQSEVIPMKKWYDDSKNEQLSWSIDFNNPYWNRIKITNIKDTNISQNDPSQMTYILHKWDEQSYLEPDWSPYPKDAQSGGAAVRFRRWVRKSENTSMPSSVEGDQPSSVDRYFDSGKMLYTSPNPAPKPRRFLNRYYYYEHSRNELYCGCWRPLERDDFSNYVVNDRFIVLQKSADDLISMKERRWMNDGTTEEVPPSADADARVCIPKTYSPNRKPVRREEIIHHGILFREDGHGWKEMSDIKARYSGYIAVKTPLGFRFFSN